LLIALGRIVDDGLLMMNCETQQAGNLTVTVTDLSDPPPPAQSDVIRIQRGMYV
jgi:hypothetical protein